MELPESLREQALDDFMEGQQRAEHWREMREALEARLKDSLAARDETRAKGEPTLKVDKKIRELRDQIYALSEEEAVSQFVEDSVRQSLERPGIMRMDVDDGEGG